MGTNYGQPQTIKFSKTLFEITTPLDTYGKAMPLKTKYTTSNFKPRREKVLAKVKVLFP